MTTKLSRNIYFSAPGEGLTAKTIYKNFDGVAPVKGAILDDTAWHRNDVVKIEEIYINTEEPGHYHVELTPKKMEIASDVNRYAEMTKSHGWRTEY